MAKASRVFIFAFLLLSPVGTATNVKSAAAATPPPSPTLYLTPRLAAGDGATFAVDAAGLGAAHTDSNMMQFGAAVDKSNASQTTAAFAPACTILSDQSDFMNPLRQHL